MFTLGGGAVGKRNSRERFDQIPVKVMDSKEKCMVHTSAGELVEDYEYSVRLRKEESGVAKVVRYHGNYTMDSLYVLMSKDFDHFRGLTLLVNEGGKE